MFDLTSSKLLLLAVVALLVIGPKDFPVLLRAIGKYVGIIRGHAREFRAQFDEAMRESELGQIKKDMEKFGRETEESLTATKHSVEHTFADARHSVETSLEPPVSASAGAASASTGEPLPSAPATGPPPAEPAASEPPVTVPEPPKVAPEPSETGPRTAGESETAASKTAAAPAVERTGA